MTLRCERAHPFFFYFSCKSLVEESHKLHLFQVFQEMFPEQRDKFALDQLKPTLLMVHYKQQKLLMQQLRLATYWIRHSLK